MEEEALATWMENNTVKGEIVMQGKVKWFNDKKGYGFITKEDDSDIFVHFSAIEMEGYKTLKADALVEFVVVDGDKGEMAGDVRELTEAV